MKAPNLNRKLTLESAVQVPDGAGGYSTTWAAVGSLWADIRAGSGREVAGIEVNLSAVTYVITLRAVKAGSPQRPTPGQRLVEGGIRRFEILAVTEAESAGRYVKCFAREEAPL